MEKKPHFTMFEIVIGTLVSVFIFDPLITAAEALPVVGGWIVGMIVWLFFVAYFHFKGAKKETGMNTILKKLGWNVIPYANTVMFIMTAVKTNHESATPEKIVETAEKLEKAGEKAKKLAGKLGIKKFAKGAG